MWDQFTIGYLAGIIQSRAGFITNYEISVKSNDFDVIQRIHQMSGMGVIVGPFAYTKGNGPTWKWIVISDKDVARLACAIYPVVVGHKREKLSEVVDDLHKRLVTSKLEVN